MDPIPTFLLKECLGVLLPVITTIVNLSLSEATMPDDLKEAILYPLLKKLGLDVEILKHFRPVSNLAFISKIIEKVVASRTNIHMVLHGISEIHQSAYKKDHSTETALTKVHSDILMALDRHEGVLLVLLDLSSAFDTVDHEKLLDILYHRLGFRDKVLAWFRSYLSNRSQKVCIDGQYSTCHKLQFGVPQGSVLGPILFTIYTLLIGDVMRKHDMEYEFYADDKQLMVFFKPKDPSSISRSVSKMEVCITEVRKCLAFLFLMCNEGKTEALVIHSKYQPDFEFPNLSVGDADIHPSMSARNIGVIFDKTMSMEVQVNAMTKSCHYQLRKISKIRNFLPYEARVSVVHAFISSKLDYCNGLLYGIPQNLVYKLQKIQNTAARLVLGGHKYDHVTPLLMKLHWLPVTKRIEFKILSMVFKAVHGTAPLYLQELIEKDEHTGLRSASKLCLKVPKTNQKTYGDRSFKKAGPTLWNKLPINVRMCERYDSFKIKLKTHLYHEAFGVL